jgi:hypothetical protein
VIEPLDDLPDGVIGFDVTGKVHADDYTGTLVPAIEQAAAAGGVRLVLVFESFDGLSGGAAWQDLKMGVEHLKGWERTALVTDVEWMSHLVTLFGWMSPGEFRHFPLAERDAAIAWAAA